VREAQGNGRSNDNRKRIDALGGSDGQVVRNTDIHILWAVRTVLLHRPDRDDGYRIARKRFQQLMPQHFLPQDLLSARGPNEHGGAPLISVESAPGSGWLIITFGSNPYSGTLAAGYIPSRNE
jgi:hypothetical protein